MTQRRKKRSRNGCRCSWCLFNLRSGWWKRVLRERDIRKEIDYATREGQES